MRPRLAAGIAVPLFALPLSAAFADGGIATPATGWYRGDLHFHTNYSEDAKSQGGDDMARAIDIAEYFEDPTLVDSFPELAGNGLDFLAITDHRTIDGCSDPDMRSDALTVMCGMEFGSDGHAGAWGLTGYITHQPSEGRTPNEQIQYAINQTLAMGGAFSPNHPLYEGDPWPWDVEGYTTVEVWNGYWTFLSFPVDEAIIDEHVAGSGVENPYIRPAAQLSGAGANSQGVRFWEAHLTVGRNLGVVGGSDRHMLVMPGEPTTYVKAASPSQADLLAGLRAGHTFVSRGPAAPQVLLTVVDARGRKSMMGDTVSLADGPFTLRAQVSRARGGRIRWIEGDVDPRLDTLGGMTDRPISEIVEDSRINEDVQILERPWDPASGRWVYVMVLDPLNLDELQGSDRALAQGLLRDMDSYGEDYVRLGLHLLPLLPATDVVVPRLCDPDEWEVSRAVCVEVDDVFMGTFHVAEPFHRVLNVFREGDRNTDYAMGAISSAIMAR